MSMQKQKGSIEIVLVTVAAIVMLGVVGFVWWNSTNAKESTAQPSSQNVKVEKKKNGNKYKTAQIDNTFPTKLSWKYPEDWTLTKYGRGPTEGETDPVSQTFVMTSPSKEYEVTYIIAVNGGFGGTCIPEYAGNVVSITREPIAGLSNMSFVELISSSDNAPDGMKYGYISGVYRDSDNLRNASQGSSMCKVGSGGFIQLTEQMDTNLIAANIRMNKVNPKQADGNEAPIKDMAAIKNAYESDEYKESVKILRSTTQTQ